MAKEPEDKLSNVPMLKKWRFKQDDKGPAGEARYWWSDGTKTNERVSSHMDAVVRLAVIQDGGAVKPSGAPTAPEE